MVSLLTWSGTRLDLWPMKSLEARLHIIIQYEGESAWRTPDGQIQSRDLRVLVPVVLAVIG
jgi:hypothetical protein